MLASSLAVGGGFTLAGTAVADSGAGGSGATATLLGLAEGENEYVQINKDSGLTSGGVILLDTGSGADKVLETYCIDLKNEYKEKSEYQETDWSSTSLGINKNSGKILWILQNSFPNVTDLSVLAKEAGAEGLSKAQAAAATQSAIWHYSDDVDAVPVLNKLDGAGKRSTVDTDAAKLTQYLVDHAGVASQPSPSLALTPSSVSGKSGVPLGPVTVSSTGGAATVSLDGTSIAAGAVLTDSKGTVLSGKDGKLLHPAKPGDALYVKAPAGANAGTATLSASATTPVNLGRAFMSSDKNDLGANSQTLILAGTKPVTVNATATATWAPAGPIPAISAAVDCTQKAVVVKATNNGDQDFTFTLAGKTVTVKPGATQSVPVPVQQGQHYDIKVTGLDGKVFSFTGSLDCQVASTTGGTTGGTTPGHSATPAAGGSTGGSGSTGGGAKLATTGGGGAAPMLAGIAGVLVVAGGGAVFAMRRRGAHSR